MTDKDFRYLREPHRQSWYEETPQECVACHQLRPTYGFIVNHEDNYDEHHVCEECLIAGSLAVLNLRVNAADAGSVQRQLLENYPELCLTMRVSLAAERTTEVEQRTPRPAIRNLFQWPAHCGDYLCFLKKIEKADIDALAPDGNGREFFLSHLHEDYKTEGEVWAEDGWIRAYLWQCTQCHEYRITWDHD